MKGFFNKILRINFKTKTYKEESVSDTVSETYWGGKGLGTFLLIKEILIVFFLSLQTVSSFSAQVQSRIPESMAPASIVFPPSLP